VCFFFIFFAWFFSFSFILEVSFFIFVFMTQKSWLFVFFLCSFVVTSFGYSLFTRTVSIGDHDTLNVAFSVPANGSVEQIVFLHGFPEGWYAWIDVIPEILRLNASYSLVIPDLPAYNQSSISPSFSDYSSSYLVWSLVKFIQQTGQPVTLVFTLL
jgi:pimeloyl-ACP methyl ester carboxylesterase